MEEIKKIENLQTETYVKSSQSINKYFGLKIKEILSFIYLSIFAYACLIFPGGLVSFLSFGLMPYFLFLSLITYISLNMVIKILKEKKSSISLNLTQDTNINLFDFQSVSLSILSIFFYFPVSISLFRGSESLHIPLFFSILTINYLLYSVYPKKLFGSAKAKFINFSMLFTTISFLAAFSALLKGNNKDLFFLYAEEYKNPIVGLFSSSVIIILLFSISLISYYRFSEQSAQNNNKKSYFLIHNAFTIFLIYCLCYFFLSTSYLPA